MIEVLFGDSEAASMKAAKNKRIKGAVKGPTSVWIAGSKAPCPKPFHGWIEGTPREVICLGFLMDIGSIKEPMDSTYRKELICSVYAQDPWTQEEEIGKELKNAGDFYAKELRRLKGFLEEGESVRIWYSNAPYARCGFYSLCPIIKEYDNQISAVKLPEYAVRGQTVISYHSWSEVSAEEFAGFLSYEKPLSKEEINWYAMQWGFLAEENSPLRAVVNNRVLSVSEDFYDFLIWKWLTEVPVKEARLIGEIIGQSQLGVGDWWYAGRIAYYIKQGKIQVVEDAKHPYARMICTRG